MKLIILLLTIILFFNRCNSNNTKASTEESTEESTETVSQKMSATEIKKEKEEKKEDYWEKLVMHEIKDNNGVVNASIPLPASWKLNVNNYAITGPGNARLTNYSPHTYMMNYDQSLQYAYSQTPMRSMPEIAQLIQEDVAPSAEKQGFTYLKFYELPEISKLDKWYSDQLFRAFPAQIYAKVYGIDLKDKNGNPALLILHVNKTETQSMQNWYYMGSLFQADKSVFETAKKQLIFGLGNMRYNLAPIAAYNKAEAQRIGQSWAAFNKKMAANQVAFEAQQMAHINKANAINDAIMNNWNDKNKAMDKNQDQFLDYVYERQNVQNNETGKQYKVEYGYNNYWMNSNGEYIATQSQDYNPNADDNMNKEKWQQLNNKK